MLGGMLAFPSAGWTEADGPYDDAAPLTAAPFEADWRLAEDRVNHVFTHFSLTMSVAVANISTAMSGDGWHDVRPAALPTLMRKVWKVARQHSTGNGR